MRKSTGLILAALACAVCCAPLLAPLIVGLGGVGGLTLARIGGAGWVEALCIAALAALVLGGAWLLWRRRKRAAACEVGGACDPRR